MEAAGDTGAAEAGSGEREALPGLGSEGGAIVGSLMGVFLSCVAGA